MNEQNPTTSQPNESDDAFDHDLELLETHLDGELSPQQAETLTRRLESEPALFERLERLIDERALRQSVFAGLDAERDETAPLRLVAAVRREAIRESARAARWRNAGLMLAAAACVAVGLFAGQLISAGQRPPTIQSGAIPANPGGSDRIEQPMFVVVVRDASGQVVMTHRFTSEADARRFTERLNDPPSDRRPTGRSNVMLVADNF